MVQLCRQIQKKNIVITNDISDNKSYQRGIQVSVRNKKSCCRDDGCKYKYKYKRQNLAAGTTTAMKESAIREYVLLVTTLRARFDFDMN